MLTVRRARQGARGVPRPPWTAPGAWSMATHRPTPALPQRSPCGHAAPAFGEVFCLENRGSRAHPKTVPLVFGAPDVGRQAAPPKEALPPTPGAEGAAHLPGVCSVQRTVRFIRVHQTLGGAGAAAFSLGSVTAECQRQLVNGKRPPGVGPAGSKSISPIRGAASRWKRLNYSRAPRPLKALEMQVCGAAGGHRGRAGGHRPASTAPERWGHDPGTHRWTGQTVLFVT